MNKNELDSKVEELVREAKEMFKNLESNATEDGGWVSSGLLGELEGSQSRPGGILYIGSCWRGKQKYTLTGRIEGRATKVQLTSDGDHFIRLFDYGQSEILIIQSHRRKETRIVAPFLGLYSFLDR